MAKKMESAEWVRVCWVGLSGISKCKLGRGSSPLLLSSSDAALPFTQDVAAWRASEAAQQLLLVPEQLCPDERPCTKRAMAQIVLRASGEPWLLDARAWLARTLHELSSLSASFRVSFVLLKGSDATGWHPVDSSSFGSVDSISRSAPVLEQMVALLETQGVVVEQVWAGKIFFFFFFFFFSFLIFFFLRVGCWPICISSWIPAMLESG
jgi:glutamine synthetase